MYITALMMLILSLCFVLVKGDKIRELKNFDLNNTLPLRGLLAVLIVCHHLGQKSAGYIPYLSSFFVGIGMPIVAVFFMISGYGLFVSYRRKGSGYLKGFLGKRYSKILPVFIALTVLAVLLWFASGRSWENQISGYVRGETPLPYSWFIYAIIFVYAAFYASAMIGKNLMNTGLILTGFIFVYIFIMRFILGFGSWWYYTILCTSLGYYIGYFEGQVDLLFNKNKVLFFGGAVAALFLTFCAMCKLAFIRAGLTVLWLMVLAFSVYLIVRSLGMGRWKPLLLLGDISLEIYLVHGIFVTGLTNRVEPLTGIWLYVVTLAISIIAAWLIHHCQNGRTLKS